MKQVVLSKTDLTRLKQIKESLVIMPAHEAQIQKLELFYFDTASILKNYVSYQEINKFLPQLHEIKNNYLDVLQDPSASSSRRREAIRKFKAGTRSIIIKALQPITIDLPLSKSGAKSK